MEKETNNDQFLFSNKYFNVLKTYVQDSPKKIMYNISYSKRVLEGKVNFNFQAEKEKGKCLLAFN